MRAVEGLLLLVLPLGGASPLLGGGRSGALSLHTLHYFETAIWEQGWRLPQFTSLAYVDDQLIGRYDTDTDQCVPQSPWIEEISRDDADFWARTTEWDFASSLVMDLMILKNIYNQSRGIHTLQALSGCELSEDHRARGFAKHAYNGRDFLSLDRETLTWTVMNAKAKPIKRKWEAEWHRGKLWELFLTYTCVKSLHTHLRYGKEILLEAEPPMVHVTRKEVSEALETLVCRLHGFYPKQIDVTWWKGGEVWHQDTFAGGVVPNSDGTFHAWISLDVDPKDRDRYRCHVEHEGLLEPLDMACEEPVSKVGHVVGVLVGVVAAVILVGAGLTFCIVSTHIDTKRTLSFSFTPLKMPVTAAGETSGIKMPRPWSHGLNNLLERR